MNNKVSTINFKGYDAVPLRALYMQGMTKRGERIIVQQMKKIAEQEGVELIVNNPIKKPTDDLKTIYNKMLSIWGQDRKAFVQNRFGKQLLWSTKEVVDDENIKPYFADFEINAESYMPRGGNYYVGYKENGEKWLLINGFSLVDQNSFDEFGDEPTEEHLKDLFDVKTENIIKLYDISNDIDEIVRPVGYPYILVNDYNLSFENLEKMYQKFPQSIDIYDEIKKFLTSKIKATSECSAFPAADKICKELEEFGFVPIRIGARYSKDINYMNAIAMKNKNNNITYITNSTKKSYPELEYLEKLFDAELRSKVPKIDTTYYVSGGKRTAFERELEQDFSRGFQFRNVIMDILANRLGGIHCMTAEVPDFDKIG